VFWNLTKLPVHIPHQSGDDAIRCSLPFLTKSKEMLNGFLKKAVSYRLRLKMYGHAASLTF
jgi:hypothetical protein